MPGRPAAVATGRPHRGHDLVEAWPEGCRVLGSKDDGDRGQHASNGRGYKGPRERVVGRDPFTTFAGTGAKDVRHTRLEVLELLQVRAI